jgi:hypothetical protein
MTDTDFIKGLLESAGREPKPTRAAVLALTGVGWALLALLTHIQHVWPDPQR